MHSATENGHPTSDKNCLLCLESYTPGNPRVADLCKCSDGYHKECVMTMIRKTKRGKCSVCLEIFNLDMKDAKEVLEKKVWVTELGNIFYHGRHYGLRAVYDNGMWNYELY